jgi:hypothetical protein
MLFPSPSAAALAMADFRLRLEWDCGTTDFFNDFRVRYSYVRFGNVHTI